MSALTFLGAYGLGYYGAGAPLMQQCGNSVLGASAGVGLMHPAISYSIGAGNSPAVDYQLVVPMSRNEQMQWRASGAPPKMMMGASMQKQPPPVPSKWAGVL